MVLCLRFYVKRGWGRVNRVGNGFYRFLEDKDYRDLGDEYRMFFIVGSWYNK